MAKFERYLTNSKRVAIINKFEVIKIMYANLIFANWSVDCDVLDDSPVRRVQK